MINTSLFEQKWKHLPEPDEYCHALVFRLFPYKVESEKFEMSGPFNEVCQAAEDHFGHPWNPIYLMP